MKLFTIFPFGDIEYNIIEYNHLISEDIKHYSKEKQRNKQFKKK